MKYVNRNSIQYYAPNIKNVPHLLYEEDSKSYLEDKERAGLAVIDKIKSNFEDFKKSTKDQIFAYKTFWEENKKYKESFEESGDIYKLFNIDYIVGVLELPIKTLSDGSIDGGFGANIEPEEEIIEGKELDTKKENITESYKRSFYKKRYIINEEDAPKDDTDDLDIDIGNEDSEDLDISDKIGDESDSSLDDFETDDDSLGNETTELHTYFVVYDISGGKMEEIMRCGSTNVVKAFNDFYNNVYKSAMKNIIIKYKEAKEQEKLEAEKKEKEKYEKQKENKLKKFLDENYKIKI